jgi:hypothetical protein
VRFVPIVAAAEVKTVLPEATAHHGEAPEIEHDPQVRAGGPRGLASEGAV